MSVKVNSVVSDISRDSFWSNNPMAKYVRHLEAKAELRKKQEIHEARERAANRLKPKKMDDLSRKRLEELKETRKLRVQKDTSTTTTNGIRTRGIPQSSNKTTSKQQTDWATIWSNHDKKTRAAVILSLMVMLFALLFMDKLLDSYMSKTYNDRWGEPWQTMFFLVYMVVAGFVHFLLCYVALMYAFSGLQIGSMTGVQAQRFYSKNVHLGVAIASGGSVALGVGKAMLVTTIRWSLWKLWIVWRFLASGFDGMSLIPNFASDVVGYTVGGIGSILSSMHAVFLQSNIVGRIVSALVLSLGKPFILLWIHFNSFTHNSILLYQDDNQRMSWGSDAYQTTRCLLLYSGFFLLSVLLIFNVFAEQVRADHKQKVPAIPGYTGKQESDIAVPSDPLR